MQRASALDLLTTRTELLADGITDRMIHDRVRDGRWRSLGKGVIRLGPDHLTWRHYAVAAPLAYGEAAAVGGLAAAYALRIQEQQPATVPVWLPSSYTPRPSGLWVPRSDGIGRLGRAVVLRDALRMGGPVRVTSFEDTVADALDGCLDEVGAVDLLTRAMSARRGILPRLRATFAGRRRLPYRAVVTDIVDEISGVRSVLEYSYQVGCERPHGLPAGELQASIRGGAVHDVAYRAWRTLVELDGGRYHASLARDRDMERDNESALQGWTTLRFGWHAVVGDPCGVARKVAHLLRQRGWEGELTRCPRCR